MESIRISASFISGLRRVHYLGKQAKLAGYAYIHIFKLISVLNNIRITILEVEENPFKIITTMLKKLSQYISTQ